VTLASRGPVSATQFKLSSNSPCVVWGARAREHRFPPVGGVGGAVFERMRLLEQEAHESRQTLTQQATTMDSLVRQAAAMDSLARQAGVTRVFVPMTVGLTGW
jgi:hypothetical protein